MLFESFAIGVFILTVFVLLVVIGGRDQDL